MYFQNHDFFFNFYTMIFSEHWIAIKKGVRRTHFQLFIETLLHRERSNMPELHCVFDQEKDLLLFNRVSWVGWVIWTEWTRELAAKPERAPMWRSNGKQTLKKGKRYQYFTDAFILPVSQRLGSHGGCEVSSGRGGSSVEQWVDGRRFFSFCFWATDGFSVFVCPVRWLHEWHHLVLTKLALMAWSFTWALDEAKS